jgi:PTH2 family peptidyl-tRNA hydrolase
LGRIRQEGGSSEYKQVIVVRTDLGMSVGKLAAQACHASVGALEEARDRIPRVCRSWKSEGSRKIVLGVASKEELVEVSNGAGKMKIPKYLVRDKGLTEIPPGSVTALGLGPESSQKLDKITGNLPLAK